MKSKLNTGLIKFYRNNYYLNSVLQFAFVTAVIIFSSCRKNEKIASTSDLTEAFSKLNGHAYGTITSEMVLKWNEAGTRAIANMTPIAGAPLPPMPESRIYAMLNVAM